VPTLLRGNAARKVIQYAGRKMIHREGRSFYDDRLKRQ
jgi:hypothetical protein